ncbi:MAG: DUF4040 domain-containing protein [Ignisphaera sp.]|nr:DUF4040 domain-containing protein [Ignisphaera sp.]MCX8167638.1 DUF4040 domain-containing protein [Ignisphaera sp.]MDW8085951.1 DUF4040 domain-containing protein [Ignisphaera sp.]
MQIDVLIIPYVVIIYSSLLSVFMTYLVVRERDLLIATILTLTQGVFYSLLYLLLMAPDLVLTYIPVSVGVTPLLLFLLVKKTERFER